MTTERFRLAVDRPAGGRERQAVTSKTRDRRTYITIDHSKLAFTIITFTTAVQGDIDHVRTWYTRAPYLQNQDW